MTTARTYPPGVTCWVDTQQPDLEAAKTFYGGLFGWTFTTATPPQAPMQYVIAHLDGQDVAGIGSIGQGDGEGEGDGPTWDTYVSVADADVAAEQVAAAGGAVLTAPADAGPGGRDALCADPAGARFHLWQARRRLGAQVTNVPGAWNFSDLHGPAPTTGFYTVVFGWVFAELGFATMIRVPGYGDHLAATTDPDINERQSGVGVPPGFADAIGWVAPGGGPGTPEPGPLGTVPHWHVTFTVTDRDVCGAEAQRLGGEVLAVDDTEWNRTALIRDPQGAVFTASQFTPPS